MGKDDEKLCAALSYVLIGVIWYFADDKMRKNPFVKFHAKQGLVLFITSLIIHAVLSVFWFIGWMLMPLAELLILIWVIMGVINALSQKKKKLFLIGDFAKKLDI